MKKMIYALLTIGILTLPACYTLQDTTTVNNPSQTFSQLDEYGQWIDVPNAGTVWRPNVSQQWQPYSDGHWVWTANGWMWDSYEPYGWVVYHYGYWDNDPQYGWIWQPSYQWAPAHVEWYNQNGYVGWAPQPYPGYQRANVYINQTNYWVVVPQKNFTNSDVVKYRTNESNSGIKGIRNNEGGRAPDVRQIESATNQRIQESNIVNEKVTAGSRQIIRARVQGQVNPRNDQNGNTGVIRNENSATPPPATRPVAPTQVTRPFTPPPPTRQVSPPLRNSGGTNAKTDTQRPVVNSNKVRESVPNRNNNLMRGKGVKKINKPKVGSKNQSKLKQEKAKKGKPNTKKGSINNRPANSNR